MGFSITDEELWQRYMLADRWRQFQQQLIDTAPSNQRKKRRSSSIGSNSSSGSSNNGSTGSNGGTGKGTGLTSIVINLQGCPPLTLDQAKALAKAFEAHYPQNNSNNKNMKNDNVNNVHGHDSEEDDDDDDDDDNAIQQLSSVALEYVHTEEPMSWNILIKSICQLPSLQSLALRGQSNLSIINNENDENDDDVDNNNDDDDDDFASKKNKNKNNDEKNTNNNDEGQEQQQQEEDEENENNENEDTLYLSSLCNFEYLLYILPCTLMELHLVHCSLTSKEIQVLASSLNGTTTKKNKNIMNNKNNNHHHNIFQRPNTNLKLLSLENNPLIGSQGVIALMNAIASSNSTIETLSLERVGCTKVGWEAILQCLQSSKNHHENHSSSSSSSIRTLNVMGNYGLLEQGNWYVPLEKILSLGDNTTLQKIQPQPKIGSNKVGNTNNNENDNNNNNSSSSSSNNNRNNKLTTIEDDIPRRLDFWLRVNRAGRKYYLLDGSLPRSNNNNNDENHYNNDKEENENGHHRQDVSTTTATTGSSSTTISISRLLHLIFGPIVQRNEIDVIYYFLSCQPQIFQWKH